MTTPSPPPIEEVRDLLGQIDEAIEQVQAKTSADASADETSSPEDDGSR